MVKFDQEATLTIRISPIPDKGQVTIPSTPCSCGGTLIYKDAPLDMAWNGKKAQVESVWAYRCNRCDVTLIPPDISDEIAKHIIRAQKIVNELPDWMRSKPIEVIELQSITTDIPDTGTCICSGFDDHKNIKSERVMITYTCGDEVIVATKGPGYRCPVDGLETLSSQTIIEFFPKAIDILKTRGANKDARTLQEVLDLERAQVKLV